MQISLTTRHLFTTNLCLDFDGVGEHLAISDNNLLSFTDGAGTDSAFSISGWLKADNYTGTWTIFSKGNNVTREYYFTMTSASRLAAACSSPTGADEIVARSSSTYAGDVGSWHHYVMTYSGSKTYAGLAIYRDGVAIATSDLSAGAYTGMTNAADGAYIARFFNTANYGDGKLYGVLLWDKELSAAEVTELYHSGKPTNPATFSASGNRVTDWRMGDGSGDAFPTIQDQTANNLDAVMQNMEAGDITTGAP